MSSSGTPNADRLAAFFSRGDFYANNPSTISTKATSGGAYSTISSSSLRRPTSTGSAGSTGSTGSTGPVSKPFSSSCASKFWNGGK